MRVFLAALCLCTGMRTCLAQDAAAHAKADRDMDKPVSKTDAEWRELLTPEQFRITRQKGTERAFTGAYWDHHADGIYHCVCCGNPLFDAATTFTSGTGWPSFFAPVAAKRIASETDRRLFTVRTEVLCRRCGAHLGHVFEDGPEPTGKRYCINSAALRFQPQEEQRETRDSD